MTVVQIRNVPDELYDELAEQARAAGQSVVRYTVEQLRERARDPNTDVYRRLRAKPKLDFSREEIVRTIRDLRGVE